MTTTSIADLRKSYERAELNEDASHAVPLQQFDQWLNEAINAQVPEPNAMTLATVGSDLRPSTRIVLIKGDQDAKYSSIMAAMDDLRKVGEEIYAQQLAEDLPER